MIPSIWYYTHVGITENIKTKLRSLSSFRIGQKVWFRLSFRSHCTLSIFCTIHDLMREIRQAWRPTIVNITSLYSCLIKYYWTPYQTFGIVSQKGTSFDTLHTHSQLYHCEMGGFDQPISLPTKFQFDYM